MLGSSSPQCPHVPVLFSEQDVRFDGDGRPSCRLTRAVLAASRHTTDAHLVLVADGFELDAVTREIMVRVHTVSGVLFR